MECLLGRAVRVGERLSAIWGCWRTASSAIQRRRARVRDPNYLIDQAFQGKHAFEPAAPLDQRTAVEDLKREYAALQGVERAATRAVAIATRDNPQASREQIIDAAVNAFTIGAFTQEEMDAMIVEANRRG